MNSNEQAQRGFKTFILTLIISLAVFSAIYYIINSGMVNSSADSSQQELEISSVNEDSKLSGAYENQEPAVEENKQDDQKSVFGELLAERIDVAPRGVLAGATSDDTVTTVNSVKESTVPVTGISRPTVGVFLASIFLGIAFFIIYLGPRKFALNSFEKKVIKDLD